ncbi:MAG TPA: porin family protein [Rhizobiales bacterium]|nr:porin family protein [Hyphomicrobiales bacterium]
MLYSKNFRNLVAGVSLAAITVMAQPVQAAGMDAVYNWDGLYAGLHLGAGFGDIKGLGALAGVNAKDKMSGVSGGVLAGWNFTSGNFLFGLEGDFAGTGINGKINILGVAVSEDVRWTANLRARAGYLLSPGLLMFGAGGLAIADYNIKTNSIFAGNDSATFTGWSLGGGIESAAFDNIRLRLEYFYTDLGSKRMFSSVGGVKVSSNFHTIRAALIYHF